jgi:hypothetical protein
MPLQTVPEALLGQVEVPVLESRLVSRERLPLVSAADASEEQGKNEGGDDRVHAVNDTPYVLAGPPKAVLLLLALLLSGAGGSHSAEGSAAEPEPPTVRWVKGHNVLDIAIIPQAQTHLGPDQPIQITLDDGAYFRIRWAEPKLPESGRLRLRLPRVAARNSIGWSLLVEGDVCNDSQGCAPFVGKTTVPKGPRLSGKFPAALVALAPPEPPFHFAPPELPSPELPSPEQASPEQASPEQAD